MTSLEDSDYTVRKPISRSFLAGNPGNLATPNVEDGKFSQVPVRNLILARNF
jgi:hypothetical protein